MPKLTGARLPVELLLIAGALSAALAFAGRTEAKGPFEVEISSGSLTAPVVVPANETEKLIPNYGIFPGAESALPGRGSASGNAYSVVIYAVGTGGVRTRFESYTYYPAGGGSGPWASDDQTGTAFAVSTAWAGLVDRYIGSAHALPSGGGAPASDGTASLWYIAPCLALAAAFLAGVAGRRLLMRRSID